MYSIVYTKKATKDIPLLKAAKLDKQAQKLIKLIKKNPYKYPPSFEKLKGDMRGAYSRRINGQHRLVYEIFEDEKTIKIISMWNHYD